MCLALGFPVQTNNIINEVVIEDETEYALLRDSFDQDTCKVNVVKVYCDDGNVDEWKAIKRYYMVCREMVLRLDTVLTLDLGDHSMMEQWYGSEEESGEGAGK